MKKIILAGGSGFLGGKLAAYLLKRNYEVTILTRGKGRKENQITYIHWDGETMNDWVSEIDGSDAVINFTGKSVNCIYTKKNKQALIESRIHSVKVLQEAILSCKNPPQAFVQAGSLAIYGNTKQVCEETSEHGEGFSVEICEKWEEQFFRVELPETRKVLYRIGFVLGKGGGALDPLKKLVSLNLGGTVGSGTQYISWLHIDDCNEMFVKAIEEKTYEGIFNATSPTPVTNKEFMKSLRKVMGKGWSPPAPAPLVWLGAYTVMRTEPSLALTGRNCIPKRLLDQHFSFQYVELEHALKDTV
ncbi:TIGR01777 family oxidoreductase [Bacillus weihaiensis]|uniref:TIGR01777 family protein n=1 Tax=Bacillus weihaiensis TaxID=1547283 RepID=A0A1L3MTE5_9BACI|nr:TIGR01777 family oxidoreductase [Bacillus weihaiensis]APH05607.1 TIGR01777 family protein [Bacillus weihaiensis]